MIIEPSADIRMAAHAAYQLYAAMQEVGFDEERAWEAVMALLTNSTVE